MFLTSIGRSLRSGSLVMGRGMTLVEMLVAMAASLIMLALVAQLMAMFSKGMNASRKGAEVYESLRAATERLKQDLSGLTAEFSVPLAPEKGSGGVLRVHRRSRV
jgi:prepilin-type N-terminal cleavage/methylation domain-containing protein